MPLKSFCQSLLFLFFLLLAKKTVGVMMCLRRFFARGWCVGVLVAIGVLWVVGAGLLVASIEFFEPFSKKSGGSANSAAAAGGWKGPRSHINHQLVSLIISLSSCVLYIVADIAIFHFGFDESWLRPVLICAWIAAVAAVPLTVLVR